MGDLVDRLQDFDFSPPCYPNYGVLTLAQVGLSPTEHTSLLWLHNAGLHIIGVVDSKKPLVAKRSWMIKDNFENAVWPVDLVLDTVGGETRERSYSVLKPGGVLVSVVSTNPILERPDAGSVFFYAEVTTERLNGISKLFSSGQLTPRVGTLLPLNDVRTAHEMLAGAPHKRRKIVLEVNG